MVSYPNLICLVQLNDGILYLYNLKLIIIMTESDRAPRCRRFVLKYKEGCNWKTMLAIKPDLNKKIKSIEQLENENKEFIVSYWEPRAVTLVHKTWSPQVEYIEPARDKADIIHYSRDHPIFICHTCVCAQYK